MDNLLRCKQDKEVKEQNCNRRNSLPMQSRPYHYGLATSSSSREQQRRSATKTENPISHHIDNRICQGDIRTVTVSQSLIRQHAKKEDFAQLRFKGHLNVCHSINSFIFRMAFIGSRCLKIAETLLRCEKRATFTFWTKVR